MTTTASLRPPRPAASALEEEQRAAAHERWSAWYAAQDNVLAARVGLSAVLPVLRSSDLDRARGRRALPRVRLVRRRSGRPRQRRGAGRSQRLPQPRCSPAALPGGRRNAAPAPPQQRFGLSPGHGRDPVHPCGVAGPRKAGTALAWRARAPFMRPWALGGCGHIDDTVVAHLTCAGRNSGNFDSDAEVGARAPSRRRRRDRRTPPRRRAPRPCSTRATSDGSPRRTTGSSPPRSVAVCEPHSSLRGTPAGRASPRPATLR